MCSLPSPPWAPGTLGRQEEVSRKPGISALGQRRIPLFSHSETDSTGLEAGDTSGGGRWMGPRIRADP